MLNNVHVVTSSTLTHRLHSDNTKHR